MGPGQLARNSAQICPYPSSECQGSQSESAFLTEDLPSVPPVGRGAEDGGGRTHQRCWQELLDPASAGSGKSNTIAWLAHRLSNLFDLHNEPVFHKTIVITDRQVLDRQLEKTIFQFDHTPGVVMKIDEDSTQLAQALTDSTSKVIISTLQKYPFVLKKLGDVDIADKRFAVIIDEAHSSQGGESAIQLKQALGSNAVRDPDEDDAIFMTRVRGKQPNLSYFAFTATPKSPTLKLFGTFDPERVNPHTGEQGMHAPFHIYSMRQAIDEGFILDVLANYITYETKWRLRNAAVEKAEKNPDVDAAKTKSKLVKYAELHPSSLSQKAKLIVDDFRENIGGRLGGRAKAMVVTSSREHAVKLYLAIRRYVADSGIAGAELIVAFSGDLNIDGVDYSEAQLNGFPEVQLPDKFDYTKAGDPHAAARNQNEYRILVVAEKYQTGFDQPLLCGMYVDKTLTGVNAVQTLSGSIASIHSSRKMMFTFSTSSTRRLTFRRRSRTGSKPRLPSRATRTSCTPNNEKSPISDCS